MNFLYFLYFLYFLFIIIRTTVLIVLSCHVLANMARVFEPWQNYTENVRVIEGSSY